MSVKLLKKLRDKEEKLLDCLYDIQDLLDTAEDSELSSMGAEFVESVSLYLSENGDVTFTALEEFVEENL